MADTAMKTIQGKLNIEATLTLLTGTHIGASKDFAPIGAVDSVVIRDPLTRQPIIPGSSLKGKLRTLLAKTETKGYVLQEADADSLPVKRLFGASKPVMPARLQFSDLRMLKESVQFIKGMGTDLYLSEIKFENGINRLTSVANPRQIERVPAGAKFRLQLNYNIEQLAEVEEDMALLARAFTLLHMDYIGGHGSRGYGRVLIDQFKIALFSVSDEPMALDMEAMKAKLEEANRYAAHSL